MAAPRNSNPTELTQDQKDILIESVFDLKPVFDTAKLMGFTSKSAFNNYLNRREPEFKQLLSQTRIDACEYIEDAFLNIPNHFKDFKMAKIACDVYSQVLSWRIPAKYSQRIDMNINQTVSITHNLNSANTRMSELIRTIVPAAIAASHTP